MPIDGIEPPTFALQERRSTTKPNRHFLTTVICMVKHESFTNTSNTVNVTWLNENIIYFRSLRINLI